MSRIAQPAKGTSPPVPVNTTPTPAATSASVVAPTIVNNHMERMEKLVSRLESIASRLENTSTASVQSTPVPVEVDKPSIIAFNDLINGSLKSFFDLSVQIGGDVAKIVN
jgi:hypothetical protein